MPFVHLPAYVLITLDCLVWALLHFVIGYIAHRMPLTAFGSDRGIYRLWSWEKNGRVYRKFFRVQAWKDKLPEAGNFFAGGFSKKRLINSHPSYLQRFINESRRGEFTHWVSILPAPFFFLWNPWLAGVFMVVYAVAINIPFIITNRFVRVRLTVLLTRIECRKHKPA